MLMRDIPRTEWQAFLDGFTRQHRHEPVTVAKSDMRDGLRVAERAAPLMAVTHDRAAHRISVTVGDQPSGEVTHTVLDPESVAVEESGEVNENPELAVHLTGGGQHLIVRLERPSAHA